MPSAAPSRARNRPDSTDRSVRIVPLAAACSHHQRVNRRHCNASEARRQRQQEHQQPRTPPRHQTPRRRVHLIGSEPAACAIAGRVSVLAASPQRERYLTSPFGTVPPSPDTPQRMLFTL